jgi:hypothetical protein
VPTTPTWPRSQAHIEALDTTLAHVASEASNDAPTIMATVSEHVCYLMPDVSDPGLPIAVLTDRDGVERFYRNERTFLQVVGSSDLMEVSTDWYVFHEGLADTVEVASGRQFRHSYVVLFPVADDGIVGEILWPRISLAEVYGADGPPEIEPSSTVDERLGRRHRHQAAHGALLDAVRRGDAEAATAVWADGARVAVRSALPAGPAIIEGTGGEAVAERVRSLVTSFQDPQVRVLNRVVGDWYVFADWIVRGRLGRAAGGCPAGALVEARSASILALDDTSRIVAELGYGLDLVELPG